MAAQLSIGQGRPTTSYPDGVFPSPRVTAISAILFPKFPLIPLGDLDGFRDEAYLCHMKVKTDKVIPLFPLGLVLMPQIPLPLHIFEERYKLMINECLAEARVFGIVFMNATDIQAVGCTAQILKVIKRYDDGRLDILTRGQTRFAIKEIYDQKAYLEARVDYFGDEKMAETGELQELAARGIALLRQFTSGTNLDEDSSFADEMDLKSVSFLIAGCEGFSNEEKQRFLEMTSTGERLAKSVESLEKMIERMKITAEIHRIIGGNGNIKR